VVRVPPRTLELRDVSVRFGGVTALDRLSLRVCPGEIVGLIGPNGAGKSTTIDAITGFAALATGSVHLDEVNLARLSRERRARAGIGRSFQSLELFDDLTVRENLQTACDEHDSAAYVTNLVVPGHPRLTPAALATVDDFGLTRFLDTKVSDLDYARRRMLAVARAVAGGHSVLLLDEPASGLDDRETDQLATLLRDLCQEGMAVLLVEHDVELVMHVCDYIYVLDFGRVIAAGTADEVRRDDAVLAAYLGSSMSGA
jgi:sulfate-transporting ATPase